ncbi:thioesterase [Vagococcus coleopterorum]|uniref:Thioesterase n=1 Tax=Vagococcus coleopterorum TaxID=2714946 RepID=A0A6G8ANF5_9ENTE|nr:thioesterase [Vagococcus coleopterorum]QIL46611.1 thioesterase [Vagococcus coleopterorum]
MTFQKKYKPEEKHTAENMGSGTLAVLATPAVIAFVENACQDSVAGRLEEGQATVGVDIQLAHLKASTINETVVVNVLSIEQTKSIVEFSFEAVVSENVIATGTHKRAIVDVERFLSKINLK